MIYEKAKYIHCKHYTRKCRKSDRIVSGNHSYGAHFHFNRKSRLKQIRKVANQKLRTHTGDVSDYGWYKKVFDVPWTAF